MLDKLIAALPPAATFVVGLSSNEPFQSALWFAVGIILGVGGIYVAAALERRRR